MINKLKFLPRKQEGSYACPAGTVWNEEQQQCIVDMKPTNSRPQNLNPIPKYGPIGPIQPAPAAEVIPSMSQTGQVITAPQPAGAAAWTEGNADITGKTQTAPVNPNAEKVCKDANGMIIPCTPLENGMTSADNKGNTFITGTKNAAGEQVGGTGANVKNPGLGETTYGKNNFWASFIGAANIFTTALSEQSARNRQDQYRANNMNNPYNGILAYNDRLSKDTKYGTFSAKMGGFVPKKQDGGGVEDQPDNIDDQTDEDFLFGNDEEEVPQKKVATLNSLIAQGFPNPDEYENDQEFENAVNVWQERNSDPDAASKEATRQGLAAALNFEDIDPLTGMPMEASSSNVASSSHSGSLRNSLGQRESGNNYKAYTSAGGGSGAVGKYQFRWNLHRSDIEKVTGVNSMEEFKNNPNAQESYFNYWETNTLKPTAERLLPIAKQKNPNITVEDIEKQVHFSGIAGATKYYTKGILTRDAFGTTNKTYQSGGKVNDNDGYLASNLDNYTDKKIIDSNHITTEGMAFPIVANGKTLYPNTGDYLFPTKKVVERPLNKVNLHLPTSYAENPNNSGVYTNFEKQPDFINMNAGVYGNKQINNKFAINGSFNVSANKYATTPSMQVGATMNFKQGGRLTESQYSKERGLKDANNQGDFDNITPNQARQILHDKKVNGHPLTPDQYKLFGYLSKGNTLKYAEGGSIVGDPTRAYDRYSNSDGFQQQFSLTDRFYSKGLTPEFKQNKDLFNYFNSPVGNPGYKYNGVISPDDKQINKPTILQSHITNINFLEKNQDQYYTHPSQLRNGQTFPQSTIYSKNNPIITAKKGGTIPCLECGGTLNKFQRGGVTKKYENFLKDKIASGATIDELVAQKLGTREGLAQYAIPAGSVTNRPLQTNTIITNSTNTSQTTPQTVNPISENSGTNTPFFSTYEERETFRNDLRKKSRNGDFDDGKSVEAFLPVVANYTSLKDKSGNNLTGNYEGSGHTCIGAVCGILSSMGKNFKGANYPLKDGKSKGYVGNETFIDNAYGASALKDGKWVKTKNAIEDVYQTTDPQVGDVVTALNSNSQHTPYDSRIITDDMVYEGKRYVKVTGSGGTRQFLKSGLANSEGWTPVEQLVAGIKNKERIITRLGKSLDAKKLEEQRLAGLDPEVLKAVEKKQGVIKHETTSQNPYKWSIRKDSPDYNEDTKPIMDKFINFANDGTRINELVKKTGSTKAEINDSLLNVFGELGQENKWQDRTFAGSAFGLEGAVEKLKTTFGGGEKLSVGPGQIKYSSLPADLKNKFDIKSPKDLYDMEKVIPLMVAMDLRDKQTLINWGNENTLSDKLIGKTDLINPLTADKLKDGVGRWSPYLRNQFHNIANKKANFQNPLFPGQDENSNNFVEGKPGLYKPYILDKGSYPDKVFHATDKNIQREIIRPYNLYPEQNLDANDPGYTVDLPEVIVEAKRKKKMQSGGGVNNIFPNRQNFSSALPRPLLNSVRTPEEAKADLLKNRMASSNTGSMREITNNEFNKTADLNEIFSNPATALSTKLKTGRIAPNFSKGETNHLDYALNVINPMTYVNAIGATAKNLVRPIETGKTLIKGVSNLALNFVGDEDQYPGETGKAFGIAGDALFAAQGISAAFKPVAKVLGAAGKTMGGAPAQFVNRIQNSPLPRLTQEGIQSGQYMKTGMLLGTAAVAEVAPTISKIPVLKKLYKDAAFYMASRSGGASSLDLHDMKSVLKNGKDVTANRYTGQFAGSGPDVIKRNLLRQYIYGNEPGFKKSSEIPEGLEAYTKRYGDMDVFEMESRIKNGQDINVGHQDWTDLSFREKLTENSIFDLNTVKGKSKQFGMDADNPAKPRDDIAGHLGWIDNTSGKPELVSQDIWKFTPEDYVKKWGADIDRKKMFAHNYLLEKQAKLMDNAGKPFVTMQRNPIKLLPIPVSEPIPTAAFDPNQLPPPPMELHFPNFKKGGYINKAGKYVHEDGVTTSKPGLWSNVHMKNKKKK